MMDARGTYCFLLHSHLPWLKDRRGLGDYGSWWFYECLAESYLPLTEFFDEMGQAESQLKFVLSCSSPLLSMLKSPDLSEGFDQYIHSRIQLSKAESLRNYYQADKKQVSEFYVEYYSNIQGVWESLDKDLIAKWKELSGLGTIEIIATSVSHSILPFLLDEKDHLNRQIKFGLDSIQQYLGANPRGFWVPECAWDSRLDECLVANGVEWVVLEPSGHTNDGNQNSHFITDAGLVIFLRHQESARLIWDPHFGYPADSIYREFHRDIGFDCDPSYISAFTPGHRTPEYTGIKLQAVSGDTYKPGLANKKVIQHAQDFYRKSHSWRSPVGEEKSSGFNIFAFDTELFGHWWFEGPEFLRSLNKLVRENQAGITPSENWKTPSQFLQSGIHSEISQTGSPLESVASSWGTGGDYRNWINEKNLKEASVVSLLRKKFLGLMTPFHEKSMDNDLLRLKNLGFKILFLLESSDWLFMITGDVTADYGRSRIAEFTLYLESVCIALQNSDPTAHFDFEQEWISDIEGFLPCDKSTLWTFS